MSQIFFELGKNSPSNFVKTLSKDKHLLLLYEDIEKAVNLQLEYLIQGLHKGECCIVAMPYKVNFEEKMEERGIDVKKYKNQNLLHTIPVPRCKDYSESFEIFKNFSEKILSLTNGKVRICAMLDFDLSTKQGMEAFITAETTSHENFDSFNGSWLCSYDIEKIEGIEKLIWIKKLFKCHDSVIIAPSYESGVAMDLN